jgi:ankyrin repeat protein
VTQQLLDLGADPNSPDPSGYAPLSWAFASGGEAIIRLLLLRGVDPNTAITYIEMGNHPTWMFPAEGWFISAIILGCKMRS